MEQLEARLIGAFFGVVAVPLLGAVVCLGAWVGMVVALALPGGLDGAAGRTATALGAVCLGAPFGVGVLTELYEERGGRARVLSVVALSLAAALGTGLSPLVPARLAPLAALAALIGTAATTGAALLVARRPAQLLGRGQGWAAGMERIGGRIKGAFLGLAAAPLVTLGAAVGWAAFALVGSVVGGIALGDRGAQAGSLVGGAGGALLAGGFAVTVLAEVRGGPDSARRVLAVLGLAALTGVGTWLSPFVRHDAPFAAAAAVAATLALTGAALLVPLDEPPSVPRLRRRTEEA